MMQDLFYLPAQLGGIPVFGWGLLLVLWGVLGGGWLLWQVRSLGWKHPDTAGQALTFAVVAVVIVFLGRLAFDASGVERGIPIRGYGLFLLMGIVAGVALAMYRASHRGVSPEVIQSLAMWLFVPGILGARLFFVLQNWEQFQRPTLTATLTEVLAFTEGGLVIFGSLIGAAIGFLGFCRRYRVPLLPLADVITPSLLLGVAFGRLGCLMNGCCYGGPCNYPWKITFPAYATPHGGLSPPYTQQLYNGTLDGFVLRDEQGQVFVSDVIEGSPVAQAGIHRGDVITQVEGVPVATAELARTLLLRQPLTQRMVQLQNGHTVTWDLPMRSRPIHPTQIYSSLNALILCLFVLAWEPFARHDGMLFAVALALKSMTRFLLEVIRVDEAAVWGTGLTISQNVGLALFLTAIALMVWIRRQPPGHLWPVLVAPPPGTNRRAVASN